MDIPRSVTHRRYTLQASCYGIYVIKPGAATAVAVVVGSILGGTGSGLVWVSQSRHYAALARAAGGSAPNEFASTFAFVYVGCEGLVKLAVATLLFFYDSLGLACGLLVSARRRPRLFPRLPVP